MQLELFPEPLEHKIERRVETLADSQDRMRKKLFQENSILKKELRDLKSDLELIKSHLCKGTLL